MMQTKRRAYWPRLRPVTSIIVPVLNEADNILPLVKRIKKTVARRKVEILFIADGPDYKTVGRVKLARTTYGNKTFDVRVYHRMGDKRWGGLSGAVADGIARARSNRIIVMDGDLQHPPEIIPNLINASRHHDVVVASRYCYGGSASGLDGGIRHFVSRGSILLAKIYFPFRLKNISDPMTGFFLVNRSKINTSKLEPKGFKILLEILATHPELTVTELPLQFADRLTGKSHSSIGRGMEYLSQLNKLRFGSLLQILSSRLPKLVQFGIIGVSVFGLGMVLLYVLVDKLGWSPLQGNAVQLAVTFWLNYLLNRKITWRYRTVSKLVVRKFIVSRTATTLFNFLLFAWLISQQFSFTIFDQMINLSFNYLVANVISLAVVFILNYIISDLWTFAESKQKPTDEETSTRHLNHFPSRTFYLVALLLAVIDFGLGFDPVLTFSVLVTMAGLILFLQSSMEVWRVAYVYREPDSIDRLKFPVPTNARENFCIIVPARHESLVLGDTLRQLAKQTHPRVSIITVICDDDQDTLSVAYNVELSEPRVLVMSYPLHPDTKPSKPKQLNYVFDRIKDQDYSVIGVIDAEDTVHPELLMHIDEAFHDHNTGIVQGGVQLMNYDSSWYSLHNVLEYYRWFNSGLAFQADNKFIPLGGNTIFVREKIMRLAGGWPETLTEDCSLGVLLSARYNVKTAVYYEPWLATREETPGSLKDLFKQRVRWSQGFFHEWQKGVWKEMPTLRQRLLADYVLLSPVLLAINSLLIPVSLIGILFLNSPVGLVMLMCLPLVPAILHLVLNAVLLRDFGKAFDRNIKLRHYAILFATQVVYQIFLNVAAFWAVKRELRGEYSWYKTSHTGKHRIEPTYATAQVSNINFAQKNNDV